MALARISITLPRDVLEAADRRSEELDRSRSWVVAEALRRYLEAVESVPAQTPAAHEAAGVPYAAPGISEYREDQLRADLALTPEQRVREAERTLALSELCAPAWRGDRVLMFDRYEDYLAWDRWAELTPP